MDHTADKNQPFNLQETLKPYLKRWWWFFLSGFLFLVLAILVIKASKPVYQVQSTVLIKDAKNSSGGSDIGGVLQELSSFGGMKTSSVDNELEIFQSKKLMTDVVRALNLQTNIFATDRFKKIELYKITSPIVVNVVNEKQFVDQPKKPLHLTLENDKITLSSKELKKNIVSGYGRLISLPYANIIITKNPNFIKQSIKDVDLNHLEIEVAAIESKVADLQSDLEVDLANKDVTVIKLEMKYPQVQKAEDILNTLVSVYNRDAVADKNTESEKTLEFIDDRINKISVELGDVENTKEDFKTKNKITDLYTEAKIDLETSAMAKEKELELQGQLELTNSLLGFVSKQSDNQLLPVNIGLNDSEASQNIILYNQLVTQRRRLLENATAENPTVVDISNQIHALKSTVIQSLVKTKQGLELAKNEYTIAQNQILGKVSQIPSLEKVFRNIERQQNLKEGLYLLLLRKREETAISQSIVVPKARVIDAAYADEKPVSPKKLIILGFFMILAFLIPFAYIYLRELFNNKFRSKQELESLISEPVIAELPNIHRNESDVIRHNDLTPMAETFRILVTNLKFMLPYKQDAKIIFVTSTVKGEGKTFVSLNLAITLASGNDRVLIIGSDIRNPQLQRYDPSKKRAKGLSEYLYDSSITTDEIIYKSQFDSTCDVIYSGMIPPNPAELLSNGRYSELLETLKQDYDYIILDTAPLLLVTDTLLISQLADTFVYVVRADFTEKSLIDFANNLVATKKINNVAFVINDVKKDSFGYGNKYGYGYTTDQRTFLQKVGQFFRGR